MNRFDFCDLMKRAKESSNLSSSELSFSMKMLLPTLRRFEKGEHNFSVGKVMEYLSVIHTKLIIYSDSSKKGFTNYEQLILWLASERKKTYSQRALAEVIGISYPMIARIESQKSNLTIDLFLKIVDVLGYNIEIESIE